MKRLLPDPYLPRGIAATALAVASAASPLACAEQEHSKREAPSSVHAGPRSSVGAISYTEEAGQPAATRDSAVGSGASCTRSDKMYFEFQVNPQAKYIVDTTMAIVPTSVRTEPDIVAQFVVDARGLPERGSIKLLQMQSPGAIEDLRIRNAVALWRFAPAMHQGCPVRQLVQVRVQVPPAYPAIP